VLAPLAPGLFLRAKRSARHRWFRAFFASLNG
jgi:hypothetical protein